MLGHTVHIQGAMDCPMIVVVVMMMRGLLLLQV